MANQQLVDYISAQKAKGVARDAINAALLGAGWSQADVTQAMDSAFGAVSTAPSIAAGAAASAAATSPFFKSPSSPAAPASGPVSFQPAATSPFSKPVSSISSPAASSPTSFGSKPVAASSVSSFDPASVTVERSHHVSKPLIAGIIVVVLLLIGGLSYWYFGSSSSVTPPTASTGGTADQATVDTLTQQNSTLGTQNGQLTAQVAELKNELSIFHATTSASVPLTIEGTLQLNAAKVFTLTTAENILLAVSNSKEAKVVSALTPLVSTKVTLSGTHAPLSTQLKVTAVNGSPFVDATATSTPATSTSSATSTH